MIKPITNSVKRLWSDIFHKSKIRTSRPRISCFKIKWSLFWLQRSWKGFKVHTTVAWEVVTEWWKLMFSMVLDWQQQQIKSTLTILTDCSHLLRGYPLIMLAWICQNFSNQNIQITIYFYWFWHLMYKYGTWKFEYWPCSLLLMDSPLMAMVINCSHQKVPMTTNIIIERQQRSIAHSMWTHCNF